MQYWILRLWDGLPEVASANDPWPAAATMHELGSLLIGLPQGDGHDQAGRDCAQPAYDCASRRIPYVCGNAACFVVGLGHTPVCEFRRAVTGAPDDENTY